METMTSEQNEIERKKKAAANIEKIYKVKHTKGERIRRKNTSSEHQHILFMISK